MAVLLTGLAAARVARADEAALSGQSAAPEGAVQPPELIVFEEASYPQAAASARDRVRVLLRLTIDAQGSVGRAEIVESAGVAFDDAARDAALRWRFRPARRGGVPAAARILYAYDFDASQMAAAAAPPLSSAEAKREREQRVQAKERSGSARSESTPASAESSRPEPGSVTVTVHGVSKAERIRQSAQAVHVIDTEQAKRETADLGQVLARSEGVTVRRSGGLGAESRFALSGLTDDQIRFFLDGVPLELAGYPFAIANVPVNLVQRVEIYRGVVPVRFGVDALGGAVNLISEENIDGTHGAASYQAGSFGTQRASLAVRTLDPARGVLTRASAFYDVAENDYPVDVEAADNVSGRTVPARVHRFHDAYRAFGGMAETGLVRRRWARRLLLRAFASEYAKELQHNVVMTVPYGAVEYGKLIAGATLRYDVALAERLSLDLVAGYASGRTHFLDVSRCIYDWFGRCIGTRAAGEIDGTPRDRLLSERSAFSRVNLSWRPHSQHTLRLMLAPTMVSRTGDERREPARAGRDPLTARQELFTLVSGVEHVASVLDERLENIAFVKDYVELARAEEPLPAGFLRERDRDTHRFGVGDAMRYRFADWLYAKASYEWATRLPRPDELFGDGVLVKANLELQPETSHNANLGVTVQAQDTRSGSYRMEMAGSIRAADRLIAQLGNDRVLGYENVYSARSLGLELSGAWTSPGAHLHVEANGTYLDFRNTSREGTFGRFYGDRVPHRPYLFANASARAQVRQVSAANDELALIWSTRYVHDFFRSWESAGSQAKKQVVPSQLLHSLGLVYGARGDRIALSFTGEIQNITDAKSFDFFGVERPGRAFYFKTTAEL